MKKMFNFGLSRFCFFEDGTPPGTTPPPTTPPGTTPPTTPPADGVNKVYTHDDVERLVQEERRRNAEQTRSQITSLEELKKNAQLTEKQRDDLQKQIENLNATLLTKEELSKKERERLENENKKAVEAAVSERDTWRKLFETSQIERSIMDAAIENDAFNPEHFLALFGTKAELVEVRDVEGKPTGRFATKIKMDTPSEDGSVKQLLMTPSEAIKALKEKSDKYGNLFKSNVTGGLGGGSLPGNVSQIDLTKLSHEEYRKHRKAIIGR